MVTSESLIAQRFEPSIPPNKILQYQNFQHYVLNENIQQLFEVSFTTFHWIVLKDKFALLQKVEMFVHESNLKE